MTREEAIESLRGILTEAVEFENSVCYVTEEDREPLEMAIKALEQCEDEYIKVPKKSLKYRTAGMVAYNAEWLKNHFDIERAVICGAQKPCDVFDKYGNYKYPSDVELTEPNTATSMPCDDNISRRAVLDIVDSYSESKSNVEDATQDIISDIVTLPPVTPQPKTGHWIKKDGYSDCSECGSHIVTEWDYCPKCGAKMVDRK